MQTTDNLCKWEQPANGIMQMHVLVYFTLIFTLLSCAILPNHTFSQSGGVDLDFAESGIFRAPSAGGYLQFKGIVVQPDQKIVTAGSNKVYRLLPDGTPDPSFGVEGIAVIPDLIIQKIAGQADGKTLLLGRSITEDSIVCIYRLLLNGDLDTSFNHTGKVCYNAKWKLNTFSFGLTVQDDGKILCIFPVPIPGVYLTLGVFRYLPDGTPDPGFGISGESRPLEFFTYAEGSTLGLQPDGKILIGGNNFANSNLFVIRLLPNGQLDTIFGNGGIVQRNISPQYGTSCSKLLIGPNAEIFVSGYFVTLGTTLNLCVFKFRPDGSTDSDFGNAGVSISEHSSATFSISDGQMAFDGQGNILLGGSAIIYPSDVAIIMFRFSPSGIQDTTFGNNGEVLVNAALGYNEQIMGMTTQSDGKVLACGSVFNPGFFYDGVVIRYLNGTVATVAPAVLSPKIFPSPANDYIRLEDWTFSSDDQIRILSTSGNIVANFSPGNFTSNILPVDQILPGYYWLEIIGRNKIGRTGFVIMR